MSDIDHIFDPQYTAADLFTNRMAEHESFRRSVSYHRERLRDRTAALTNVARHHVLTFYGIGGIGKTELSRRLERWLLGELPETDEWGPGPSLDLPTRTVRFDFHGSAGIDAAATVFRLRAALADSRRRFPAFDLGFAAWWAFAHPGTALPNPRSPAAFDVRAQINDTINGLLSEAGARFGVGPLPVRTGSLLVKTIRSRLIRSKALRECEPLNAVIEQIRFDPSPYVASITRGMRLGFRTGVAAKILCLPADDPGIPDYIAEVDSLIDASRVSRGWQEFASAIIHAMRRGDESGVANIRAELVGARRSWTPNYQVVDRMCVYAGHPPIYKAPKFETEETAAASRRWHTVIDALVRQ